MKGIAPHAPSTGTRHKNTFMLLFRNGIVTQRPRGGSVKTALDVLLKVMFFFCEKLKYKGQQRGSYI